MSPNASSTGVSLAIIARWAGAVFLALIVVLLVLRIALLTPLASSLVENSLDGRSVGDGLTLNVDGVSGDLLGRIQVAELSVSDAEGVWLTLEDVRLHWSSLAATRRHAIVRELSAASLDVARKPIRSASSSDTPRKSFVWPAGWSLTVDRAAVSAIHLAEGVAGPAAAFTFDASADVDAGSLQAAELTFARADALGDILFATAGRNDAGRLVGSAQLEAAAGGPLAAMLKTPDSAWSFAAGIQDTGESASGQGRVMIDGADVLVFDGHVDDAGAHMSAHLDVAAAPYTRDLTDRLGAHIDVRVLTELDEFGGSRLAISADSDVFTANFTAPVNGGSVLDIRAGQLSVSVASPPDVLGLEALESGPFQVVGEVLREEGVALSGVATLSNPAVHGVSAAQLMGPVSAQFNEGEVAVGATIAATDMTAEETIANVLGATPNLSVDARFDTHRRVADVDSLRLAGEHLELSFVGEMDLTSGAIEFEGAGELATLEPTLPGAAGAIALTTELSRSGGEEPAELTIGLRGEGLALTDARLTDLIGASPQLVANATITPDGASLGEARVTLAQASLEASGGVDAEGLLTVDVDGAATGVVPAGPVEIAGATALAAELRGSLDRPTLRMEARVDQVSAGDRAIDDMRLRFEADDLLNEPFGRARLDGAYDGETGSLSSAFDLRDGRLSLSAIDGRWREASLSGEVAVGGDRLPVVALNAGDARGAVTLSIDVLTHEGAGYLLIEGDAREASVGDQIALQSGSLRAEGRFDDVKFLLEAVGDGLAPFDMSVTGGLSLGDDNAGSFYLTPHGQLGGADIQTIQPLGASWRDERVTVAGMLAASGGRIELDGDYSVDGVRADIAWTDVPLSLLDALRDDKRLAGRLHGSLSLAGADEVTGRADAALTDARLAGALPASGIDAELTADLSPGAVAFDLHADDKAGLNATMSGVWPVQLAAAPFGVGIPANEPVSVNIDVQGPIDGLWSIVGSETVDVAGVLKAQITVAGSHDNPAVSGDAALTDGRVEDTVIGLRLLDVGANAAFNGESIVVSDVTGHDGVGGRATGSGDMRIERANAPSGEVRIALDTYRIANRDDAEMTASGSVDLVFDDGSPTLKVDMLVDEAEFAPVGLAGASGSATPTLDVVEINRPAYLAPPPTRQSGPSLALDARVRANRRVFVRAPTLESEWSFDVRVEGEADAPNVNGSATLMRGEFDLAGEGFDFDEGTITFRGDLDNAALNLTARRDASDLTARLRITGTLAEPEIALESTPSFPEDEILARILFDRSASELTALEAAQLAAALAQLARGGFGVTDVLRQELGLDRLRVAGDAEGGAIVTGGKYIADGVYLEVGARGEGGAVAAIEWEIRPRLELVSRFSDADEAQIALRWRRDY